MSKVTIARGSYLPQVQYIDHHTDVVIDTNRLKKELNIKRDAKLLLAIRDTIMIKALRAGRNVFLMGDHALIEQIERIDEILEAQGQIDGKKYTYKVKDF